MNFPKILTRLIEFSFYALFLLVPLVFTDKTSELFEFNKMWVTFIITIFIGFLWFSKMIFQRKVIFTRTILDIPIAFFLTSHIISTIISLDSHVSFWGYYSRWNGGLLSMLTYVFLYYAFVSNFWNNKTEEANKKIQSFFDKVPTGKTIVKRSLLVSLVSGFIVILWSLPSHFGYDPTCFVFRGTLDVSCWTNDFQPKVRIFGPLGQPDWLAGYLGILIPIAGSFILTELKKKKDLLNPHLWIYSISFILFYLALLYTGSRSGIISGIASIIILFFGYFILNFKNLAFFKNKFFLILIILFLAVSFIAGVRLPIVDKFSLSEIQKITAKPNPSANINPNSPSNGTNQTNATSPEEGGSNSLHIRLVVWEGAINAWKANPIFGTGVETFAYAYYKYRPIEHNKLSEWNFLYNKAHNEYLNYLATTGLFGLLSYMSFVLLFLIILFLNILKIKIKTFRQMLIENFDNSNPLALALASSLISILVINFFGFSVVILNIYLFLIPAFVLVNFGLIKQEEVTEPKTNYISYTQYAAISVIGIFGLFFLWILINYWRADTKYGLGYNYNHVREYQTAYPLLHDAVKIRPEPVYLDEMAVNNAFTAIELARVESTQSAQIAQALVTEALSVSDKLVTDYPHNVVFWKSRVRILYTLSGVNSSYLPQALEAIKKTEELAPTDASVLYNLGIVYGQSGDIQKAVKVLEKTVSYKPDYIDAHFALGLFYHDLSINDKKQITNKMYHEKAINELKLILDQLDPENKQAKESLDLWSKEK